MKRAFIDSTEANVLAQSCVHFGFCTAVCPTYVLLGDELDSPRGRIELIKEIIANPTQPSQKAIQHLDQCLSCMACMGTCAAQVNYSQLIDHARYLIEESRQRAFHDRFFRSLLLFVLQRRWAFRWGLRCAMLLKSARIRLPGRLRHLLDLASPPAASPSSVRRRVFPAAGTAVKRVALLVDCAPHVLMPQVSSAAISLLTRAGCEVVVLPAPRCCGALALHLGKQRAAIDNASATVLSVWSELQSNGLDALLVTASGCGTTVKDYGHMLRNTPLKERARTVAALTQDIAEFVETISVRYTSSLAELRVAYHDPCSLQFGQKIREQPRALLRRAGYQVVDIPEAHFCCGSAGTYNLVKPEIAKDLGKRKAHNIQRTRADIVATGNVGCIVQISRFIDAPVVHIIQLLDWASGGRQPEEMRRLCASRPATKS